MQKAIERALCANRLTSASKWGLCGAAVLATALAVAACIPPGDCTGDCENAGGGGGGGGGGSSGGGSGGGGASGGDVLGKTVENCGDYPTIGEVETKLIKVKCGDPSGCHGTSGAKFPPELKTANMYERLFDKPGVGVCTSDKLIDSGDSAKSMMLTKLGDTPKCTDGSDGGAKMPFSDKTMLTDGDKTCLQEYVKAVIAAKAN
ncbi:MAG: hypothetical protein SF187_10255 [Deltaproteobacteria bacterium]|nr:hypothetical protein [Deltaproteobacteria bacterium]